LGAELYAQPVETLPLSVFRDLPAGSLVSIDSSHRGGTGSDVNHLYLEVLPSLAPGTLIHVHDVFLPEDYPASWNVDEAWGYDEQYLLRALLAFSNGFRVIWPGRHVLRQAPEALAALFPREDLRGLTCSFVMERTGVR